MPVRAPRPTPLAPPPTRRPRRSRQSRTKALLGLLLTLCLLAGCGAEPRPAAGPLLYLAGDRELWVVDVAHQRVRHVRRSLLDVGDAPHRILARGRSVVMGSQFGGSTFFLPSVHRDRIWLVDIDPRTSVVRAVREVTTGGVTTEPASVPPHRAWPLAAVDDGLLLGMNSGVDVWDPRSGRVVRHLPVDAGTLGPTTGRVMTSCTDPQCHALALTDPVTGATRAVKAPRAFTFEPWTAAFSPDGSLLAIPIRIVADGPRQLALVDVKTGRVAVIRDSEVSPGYTLVAWSASGRAVFLTGGGAYATPRVLVGYRIGALTAQPIHVDVGDFFDVAAI